MVTAKDHDIILSCYKQIINKKLRDKYKLNLKNAILVFDEAHNLEACANEEYSCALTIQDFNDSIKPLQNCIPAI